VSAGVKPAAREQDRTVTVIDSRRHRAHPFDSARLGQPMTSEDDHRRGADGVHVVVGAGGATGRLVVAELHRLGHRVRAVTRDGRTVGTPGVDLLAVDASDPDAMNEACREAVAVYHCAMPPLDRWVGDFPVLNDSLLAASARTGARLVYADDTWMYGRVQAPMDEQTPYRPVSSKGVLRAWLAERLLRAGDSGRLPVSVVRAGELYGPGVRSMIGANVFRAAARGRTIHWFGDPDAPLTPTYVGDFARTIAAAGLQDTGKASTWHVPHPAPSSGRALAALACAQSNTRPRLAAHGTRQLKLLGNLLPLAREGAELVYQFEQPFVVDGRAARTAFGIAPTPLGEGVARTLRAFGVGPGERMTS
jgi:nucleoside-diphosphate-sugar epimerase